MRMRPVLLSLYRNFISVIILLIFSMPEEKRPRGYPRKRWVDVVEKYLEGLGGIDELD